MVEKRSLRPDMSSGFDWAQVGWAGPDQPTPDDCSYCDTPIGPDEFPFLLFMTDGWCAAFCDACRRRWWKHGP